MGVFGEGRDVETRLWGSRRRPRRTRSIREIDIASNRVHTPSHHTDHLAINSANGKLKNLCLFYLFCKKLKSEGNITVPITDSGIPPCTVQHTVVLYYRICRPKHHVLRDCILLYLTKGSDGPPSRQVPITKCTATSNSPSSFSTHLITQYMPCN